MNVLIDTNVVLDVLLERAPFVAQSAKIAKLYPLHLRIFSICWGMKKTDNNDFGRYLFWYTITYELRSKSEPLCPGSILFYILENFEI